MYPPLDMYKKNHKENVKRVNCIIFSLLKRKGDKKNVRENHKCLHHHDYTCGDILSNKVISL